MMFTEYRAPVLRTTGICPTGAHVVPGVVVRADARLVGEISKYIVAPAFFASARMAGNTSFFHRWTASGSYW
jgi:hypothetical protein